MFCSKLATGKRFVGGQFKRFKDTLIKSPEKILAMTWTHGKEFKWLKRDARKVSGTRPPGFHPTQISAGPTCGRSFLAQIGLSISI